MVRVVAMYLTAGAAPAVLLIGLWGAVFAYGAEGPTGAARTLLLAVGLAAALLWLNGRLRRSLNPPAPALGGWTCRRCGTSARPGDGACVVCGEPRSGGVAPRRGPG
jgi:hypothetical protein